MRPIFAYMSIGCIIFVIARKWFSDKMQTKTAKKETRNAVARIIPDLQIFIQWRGFPQPLQR